MTNCADDFFEFVGIDYSKSDSRKIRFRASTKEINLRSSLPVISESRIKVPKSLEVLTKEGWQKHAIVFYHIPQGYLGSSRYLVFVMAKGDMHAVKYNEDSPMARIAWRSESQRRALTEGRIGSD